MSSISFNTMYGSNENPIKTPDDKEVLNSRFCAVFGTEALLKLLILISGSLLGVVVFLHVGVFSHSDYIQGDIRYQKLKAAALALPLYNSKVHGTGNYPTASGPLSNQLMTIGYIAEICLTTVSHRGMGTGLMGTILRFAS
jgi:hypothetical protein